MECSEADGEAVVVGFDVDDGAFVGWVGDGFGVFFDAGGHGGSAYQCSSSVTLPFL